MTTTLLDATGAQLAELPPAVAARRRARTRFAFDGLGQPDGRYMIVIAAVGARRRPVTQQLEIGISRALGPAVDRAGRLHAER